MAYTTLKSLFTGICDAIRSKEGSTASIDHQDIPDRILALQTTPTIYKLTAQNLSTTSILTLSNTKMTTVPTQFWAGCTDLCSALNNYIYSVYNIGTNKNSQYGAYNGYGYYFTWDELSGGLRISNIAYSAGQVKITLTSGNYFATGNWICYAW